MRPAVIPARTSPEPETPSPSPPLSSRHSRPSGAAIQEVTLMYPPAKGQGRPRILRKLTRMDQTQQGLFELFGLDAFAPREGTTAKWRGF